MNIEKKRLIYNSFYPSLLVMFISMVTLIENTLNLNFSTYGIIPGNLQGLRGIFLSPLLHADYDHLYSNMIPMWFLTYGLFYYYKDKAFTIFGIIYILPGLLTWIFADGNIPHIGASGVVYALAAFHFLSGIIKMEIGYMAYAMIVIFLYGSMVWGVFPELFPEKNISWEGHLMGFVGGIFTAIYFRKAGPKQKVFEWPDDEEDDDDDENAYWKITNADSSQPQSKINYTYKENKEKK